MGPVTQYLAKLPPEQADVLTPYFDRARTLVPDAVEGMKYAMPALVYRDRGLVSLMPTRAGFSVYPYNGFIVSDLMARYPGFSHTKGAIHFTSAHRFPIDGFDELIRASRARIDASQDVLRKR
jgi:uncharacterized protein YdhG (YjbR/CyaY superfamily)